MALVVNDIVQITLEQRVLSQIINNVFFYKTTVVTGTPLYDDVTDTFAITVLDIINACQTTGTANLRVILKNLTNGIDIYEVPNTATGDRTGENMPSFVALGFRLVRTDASTRNGGKRIGGLSETDVSGNGIIGGFADEVAALAVALAAPLNVDGAGGDATLVPVIVGRVHIPDPDAGQLDLSVINLIQSAQYIRVTSQTTRREGRGV